MFTSGLLLFKSTIRVISGIDRWIGRGINGILIIASNKAQMQKRKNMLCDNMQVSVIIILGKATQIQAHGKNKRLLG